MFLSFVVDSFDCNRSYDWFYIVECICWIMKKEIVVSLWDDQLKDVAEVLGNKSAKKILNELAVNDLSVSEIAKNLGIKINTVDYNVRKLVKVGLVEKVDHWWSVKGRKMLVYRASNRKIIISPKRKNLKKVLAGWCVLGLGALFWKSREAESFGVGGVAKDLVFEAVPEMESLAMNAGMSDAALRIGGEISFWASFAGWEWFLLGVWVSVLGFFVWSMFKGKMTARHKVSWAIFVNGIKKLKGGSKK